MKPTSPIQGRCTSLAHIDYLNFTLSLLLLIGILLSYLPQHIRIILRRSSFGISPYFVLLGTTSGTCAFANILVLPTSRADVACCHQLNGLACFAGLLGILQVGMQWSCFCVILLLFLIYFPRDHSDEDDSSTDLAPETDTNPLKEAAAHPSFKAALAVFGICIAHLALTLILSLVFALRAPSHLQGWANFLGVLATILASIQYFPQIYTTYTLKRVGSLSIPMMCIQTPGSFVWSASLAARLGWEGWSAWGVYLVTGALQGTLLVMGVYYEIVHGREEERKAMLEQAMRREGNGSPIQSRGQRVDDADEQTPLLRTERD